MRRRVGARSLAKKKNTAPSPLICLIGDRMKKYMLLAAAVNYLCGMMLRMSFVLSGHAAWSYIISSVNGSAWELFKPFAVVYIAMIIIELSVLRPSLAGFICAKAAGLCILCFLMLLSGTLVSYAPSTVFCDTAALFCTFTAQAASYAVYRKVRFPGCFALPAALTISSFVMLIIVFSFYPLHLPVFFDSIHKLYGRTLFFDAAEPYKALFVKIFL